MRRCSSRAVSLLLKYTKHQSNINLEIKTHAYDLHFKNVYKSKFLCYIG